MMHIFCVRFFKISKSCECVYYTKKKRKKKNVCFDHSIMLSGSQLTCFCAIYMRITHDAPRYHIDAHHLKSVHRSRPPVYMSLVTLCRASCIGTCTSRMRILWHSGHYLNLVLYRFAQTRCMHKGIFGNIVPLLQAVLCTKWKPSHASHTHTHDESFVYLPCVVAMY